MKDMIEVSPEMLTFVGIGDFPAFIKPAGCIALHFDGFAESGTPAAGYNRDGCLDDLKESPLILLVQRTACLRIFGFEPDEGTRWHLSNKLRECALSLIDCEASGEARTTLRLARSIELLCQFHEAIRSGELVAIAGEGALSEMDVARIANARRIVDQHWHEKITISDLSRMAGVNRDKLVRGFRELYDSSIAEVLSERRLAEARKLLLVTDLPVASVAYRCAYLNNASFTRAFSRHYGLSPTELRRAGVAA